ncbi:hypothetical protein BD769DRAFT_1384139 [Suillus cothurnatus]|nr:hypothetical protein BD769DRAFT_1384139 [Suillus cothurnatus]
MVKYCGYLVSDSWLQQRALDVGHSPPKTFEDRNSMMLLGSRDLMARTGVLPYTSFRRVKTPKGKYFWCIAFACNDPWEQLPTRAPLEEKYKALKEALGREGPPRWYRAG